jgi:arabinan endo-1,5-alpha-L-arabinosidase
MKWSIFIFLFLVIYPSSAMDDPDLSLLEHYDQLSAMHTVSEWGWHIHDPSRIVELDDYFMIAVTGKEQEGGYQCGLELWYMIPNTDEWTPGQCLLMEKPDWVNEFTPNNDGAYWAPSFADPYTIYYTVSNMSDNDQMCMGMIKGAGSPPHMQWEDFGSPIFCFNAIDAPTIPLDSSYIEDEDGNPYLVFGGGTIWVVELDPLTGQVAGDARWHTNNESYHYIARIAADDAPNNPHHLDWAEAAYMYYKDGYYYLFLNWGGCCRGLNSTYEIRVGRSTSVTGPFFDQDGLDMRDGGGTIFLDRYGEMLDDEQLFAPGHAGIYQSKQGTLYFTFHYYDAENEGIPWIASAEIEFWDGWPEVVGVEFVHNSQ